MASIVEICNIGLQELGVTRMATYPDTVSRNGKEMTFAYEPTKLYMLRRHRWNFAKKQDQLAADTDTPDFDFAKQYTLPADCVRVLLPSDRANIYGRIGSAAAVMDWHVHGRKIFTNWEAPLDVTYIADVVDPNVMDPLFRRALGLQLGIVACKRLTGSNTLRKQLKDDLKEVIAEARAVNAIEHVSQDIPEDDWISVRG